MSAGGEAVEVVKMNWQRADYEIEQGHKQIRQARAVLHRVLMLAELSDAQAIVLEDACEMLREAANRVSPLTDW